MAGMVLWPARPGAEIVDRVLARVGGRIITLSDVRAASELGLVAATGAPDPVRAALDQLIDRELVLAEVDRYQPPEPDPADVDRRVAQVTGRIGSEEEFRRALATGGMTMPRLRDFLRDQLRIEGYLNQRFGSPTLPTDEEIVAYYNERGRELARAGAVPPLADIRNDIRTRIIDERRRILIAEWIAELRKRGDVNLL
jgi:hypothetical protein